LLSTVNQGVGEWGSGGAGERQSGPPPLSDQLQSYVFLHDRMQQAAYAMIPAEQRQSVHLTVGRLLRARGGPDELEEKLFDLVHHLNLGSSLIFTEAERLELARLNLRAGWKAKAATAFEAALGYFQAGARLLNEADWETSYDLAFALHLEAAECQPLCGQIAAAEQAFATLLNRARTPLDQAQVYRLRIILAETQSRYTEAIASARAALALFGVAFPAAELEQRAALEQEIETIQNLRGARQIAELVELPAMTDPAMRMVMSILMTVWSSAYIAGQQLLTRLLSATLVRLSLQHGNAEESAYGYATHTITVGPGRKDYAAAYEFGLLALRINERFNDRRRRAKIYQQFHAHANLWRQPWQSCLSYAREASRSGFETGDFTYGVYGAFTETWVALVCTPNLADYLREYAPNVALCQKLRMSSLGDAQQVLLHWARALRGETRQLSSLSDETFDEEQYWARYRDNAFFAICHLVTKLQLCYHSAAYDQALTLARLGRTLIQPLEGTLWPVVFAFWNGLTLAANYAGASPAERADFLAELAEARRLLTLLADHCPENYRCMALLLAAESERLNGQELKAAGLYEEAIRAAEMRGSPQQRALANELCAQFWAGRGQAKAAAVFLTEAREVYAQWGAAAKVVDLETRHAAVFNTPHVAGWSGESALPRLTEPGALDLFSVMKAAQAIAGEIELDKLLAKLLRIVIENAGAERGALLLEQGGAPHIYATGTLAATEVTVTDPPPLSPAAALPLNVINYVRRTAEDVVLADAAHTAGYGNDPYLRRPRPPRSLLCAPVRNQGRLLGVLYLENNLATGAFTPERLQVVQWLAAQAAVSLENARLYAEMKGEAESRQRAEQTLRSIMEGTAALTGGDFFASLVRHLAAALQVRFAFITECREPNKSQARTLAFWEGDRLAGNVTYEVAETPCLRVLAGETCYYPTGLQQHFPRDTGLVKMNAESYLGIPLRSSRGEVIGHLAVLDDKPLVQTPQSLSLLNIFAARAGAELERLHAEAELRVALAEVERLKNQLHAENLYLQEEIRREHNFEEIVGSSPALLETLHEVERIALADSTVLIYGETGTGKELIARALHDRSTRRNRPLVKVNCGAISAGLVESELFGHVKGAFTGALDRRVGRFELADGGTLFLDEVGELPLDTQTKLLRVLQEGEFEPVGSSKTQRVNVRIIAATNRKLEEEVRAGGFRADLFYRLNVLPLTLPPLRERRADIPALVAFFLARFAKKFGKSVEGVSQETMQLLVNYAWPGNIRELQNLIERGVALARHPILTIDPAMLPNTKVVAPRSVPAEAPARVEPVSQSASLDETQRQHILAVLRQTGGVIEGPKGAALILNLHPNTLRSRMKKLGIQRSQYVPQHSS
jgi:transcriptional regulator with GAF, ATPase, and Fis domain